MIRKGESNTKIDELVRELDEHFLSQLASSTQKVIFVSQGSSKEKELQMMYEDHKVKSKLSDKKLKIAVGLGILMTGFITGCTLSSMRKNTAGLSLQTTYTPADYTGTATLDSTNSYDV